MAISHAIMSAVRPRSFVSPLQLGLSVYLHRQFGSKRLLEVLACLGLKQMWKRRTRRRRRKRRKRRRRRKRI